MVHGKRITNEDLLITEKLIAGSYDQLKQSVIQAPSLVYNSVDETVRKHPVGTVISAVIAGGAVYGIINMITARDSVQKQQEKSPVPGQVNANLSNFNQEILMMVIPLVTPYIMESILKYLGDYPSKEEINQEIRKEI